MLIFAVVISKVLNALNSFSISVNKFRFSNHQKVSFESNKNGWINCFFIVALKCKITENQAMI